LLNITGMITSGRMRYVGHVACMWWARNAWVLLVGKVEGKRLFGEDLGLMGE
jgi:hypothetical protein